MKYLYVLLYTMLLSLALETTPILANENAICCEAKIYIEAEDVILQNDGIFVLVNDVFTSVSSIHVDELGLFAIPEVYRDNYCKNGHFIFHPRCNGCAWPDCPYYCRCFITNGKK